MKVFLFRGIVPFVVLVTFPVVGLLVSTPSRAKADSYRLPDTGKSDFCAISSKNSYILKNSADPAIQNWLAQGDTILHKFGGDDTASFFGFRPELTIANTPLPNAFALRGGKVIISKSLLDLIQSPSEYAFVLAHELGHIMLKHHTDSALLGEQKSIRSQLNMELEADNFAIKLLSNSGFDTHGALKFLETISNTETNANYPIFSDTYPSLTPRVDALKMALADPLTF